MTVLNLQIIFFLLLGQSFVSASVIHNKRIPQVRPNSQDPTTDSIAHSVNSSTISEPLCDGLNINVDLLKSFTPETHPSPEQLATCKQVFEKDINIGNNSDFNGASDDPSASELTYCYPRGDRALVNEYDAHVLISHLENLAHQTFTRKSNTCGVAMIWGKAIVYWCHMRAETPNTEVSTDGGFLGRAARIAFGVCRYQVEGGWVVGGQYMATRQPNVRPFRVLIEKWGF